MATTAASPHPSGLAALPAELLIQIFAYLPPLDLISTALTCRTLSTHSYDDRLWQILVNDNLPEPLTTPGPLPTFRELFAAHHPYWFLPKHRLWFGDGEHQGKLVVSRFDPARGSIDAYTVAAQRGKHALHVWERDREVIIHDFNPKVTLDLNKPVLRLDIGALRTNDQPNNEPSDRGYAPPSVYSKEIIMETPAEAGLFSSFMLCRALPSRAIGPQTAVWPTRLFPCPKRVRNDTMDAYHSYGHRPSSLEEVSEYHWRLRKWVEYSGRRSSASFASYDPVERLAIAQGLGLPYLTSSLASATSAGINVRLPESVTTFGTVPEAFCKPTSRKPWQGLWCGDYSGHGCEFLLVLQPDKKDELPLPEGMDWLRGWFRGDRRDSSSGSDSSYASAREGLTDEEDDTPDEETSSWPSQLANRHRRTAERMDRVLQHKIMSENILAGFTDAEGVAGPSTPVPQEQRADDGEIEPRGRLECIKLTGDPNIPRGEYTFIAPDIGDSGLLRVADEEPFKGARIVRSAGHIAGRNFREGMSTLCIAMKHCPDFADTTADQYTPSQLIMISHDRLAQFWEGFGHISYFQRVDVEALMKYNE